MPRASPRSLSPLFLVAILAVLVYEAPYLALGADAPIRVHDNLEPLLGVHAAQRYETSRAVDGTLASAAATV